MLKQTTVYCNLKYEKLKIAQIKVYQSFTFLHFSYFNSGVYILPKVGVTITAKTIKSMIIIL